MTLPPLGHDSDSPHADSHRSEPPHADPSGAAPGPVRSVRGVAARWHAVPATQRRLVAGSAGLFLVLVVGSTVLSRTFTVSCADDVPCLTLDEIASGKELPEAIELVDRTGKTLAEVAGPLRRSLDTERLPDRVRSAFVAVEDRRFYEHGGVDARGVIRAAFKNVRAGGVEEGASTIPMQLVRTLWAESLREVGPWRRKVIEAFTAPRMIDRLGHEEVLTLYLNSIYMGNGLYGVERAANHYFDKGVADLDVAELATLVGMTQGPERYEPRRNADRARVRRDVVVGLLEAEGLVTAEEAEVARARPVETTPAPPLLRHRSYMSAAVTRELRAVAPELAGTPGIRIFTTIDPVVQQEGERALAAQLDAIEGGRYGRYAVSDTTVRLQGAAVALDPYSGAVRGWVGGRDFVDSEFDRVGQARRQVGSLFKPFLVASAVERGTGILSLVSADTVPIMSASGPWLPNDHVQETILPLREALVRSSNRAAAHLAMDLGLDAVSEVGHKVGISGPIPQLPSTSIGAFDASLLEMTGAYAVFGNGGQVVEPFLIEQIERRDGTVLWTRALPEDAPFALQRTTSFVVLDALRDVVDRGTAYSVRAQGYWGPAAGKTGTTNEGRDAWFIGLTPDLVAGIWVGLDTPGHIVRNAGGGALAAPAWGQWMRGLERAGARSSAVWLPPVGVERVRYDRVTGEAVTQGCPSQSGTQPLEAWVVSGSARLLECRGGVRGWLTRAWHTLSPPQVRPLEPTRVRPRGGNQ